jgi:hypothetical protein
MTRLAGRLKKLEASIGSPRAADFGEVYRAALEKLSPSERDLVEEIMAYRADRFVEPYQSAWDRLQKALVQAGKELGPDSMVILGVDLLL